MSKDIALVYGQATFCSQRVDDDFGHGVFSSICVNSNRPYLVEMFLVMCVEGCVTKHCFCVWPANLMCNSSQTVDDDFGHEVLSLMYVYSNHGDFIRNTCGLNREETGMDCF